MDCNTSYVSYISKSWNYVFWKLFNISASTVDDMCDSMNMMTMDVCCHVDVRNLKLRWQLVAIM